MSDTENLPRIHKLSTAVANQIAAGEVIERPASVVKELIENSLDAGASKIYIDLEEAGIGLIRVRDNGQGIHKDDLALALQAHATSKLSSFSDLSQIVSMGFRGEAIPSIASVSRFNMTSRLIGSEHAWSIDNELQVIPAAHEVGTTVEVNDLFFSTPGRRKFLKTEKTEYLHIQSLIRAIALSHFSTAIYVKHNKQSMFNLPAYKDDIEKRVESVCGRSLINKSVQVDIEKSSMRLWGWLGLNEVARSQSDRQYFYVNGRIVRDKHVNHAIRLAYDDRIATGRYPSYLLHLEIDPALVDINVHPAKSEVRFSETRNVHDFIYSSLLESLAKPVVAMGNGEAYQSNDISPQATIREAQSNYNLADFKQTELLANKQARIKYLTLFSDNLLIALFEDEHFLIDIADSRVLITEKLLIQSFEANNLKKRPILVPLSCELHQDKIELINEQKIIIEQWGFELEQIAPTQVKIRSIPAILIYAEAISLVNDLLGVLEKNKPPFEIANILASHVNDSGTTLDDKSLIQLLNQIINFENAVDDSTTLPWRKLDKDSLTALIKNK